MLYNHIKKKRITPRRQQPNRPVLESPPFISTIPNLWSTILILNIYKKGRIKPPETIFSYFFFFPQLLSAQTSIPQVLKKSNRNDSYVKVSELKRKKIIVFDARPKEQWPKTKMH
jgi:hypothetical protein